MGAVALFRGPGRQRPKQRGLARSHRGFTRGRWAPPRGPRRRESSAKKNGMFQTTTMTSRNRRQKSCVEASSLIVSRILPMLTKHTLTPRNSRQKSLDGAIFSTVARSPPFLPNKTAESLKQTKNCFDKRFLATVRGFSVFVRTYVFVFAELCRRQGPRG